MASGNRVVHPVGRGAMLRDMVRLAGEALAAGVFVSFVLALAAFVVASQAHAAPPGPPGVGPGQGALVLKSAGVDVPAPLLLTDVAIDVTGLVARTRVTQHFHNPSTQWQEGVYVFPLPEGAAVDHLDMSIGERRVEGQIKERRAAQQAYAQAKQEGRKASLVEQQRPNVFTTSVANIGPDEDVVIAIEYQEAPRYGGGSFRLRFPMVLTPRYTPPRILAQAALDAEAAAGLAHLAPPMADRAEGMINPVTLTVTLAPGFPLATLESAYHKVHIEEAPGHRYRVVLDGPVPADRDFELVWKPDVGATPGAALFMQHHQGVDFALLMLVPPTLAASGARTPREVVFIVDTSGSMEGSSIQQAKRALELALDRLQAGDRFNVIEFNSVTRALFGAPLPVDRATLGLAHAFVASLRAHGGTEMRPALEAALSAERAEGYVRQVVFLTDGAVGNEAELFGLITQRLGDRRLFTVGIGSAPNAWFMTKAAQYGRGSFTYIGAIDEVQAKMAALFEKLEAPVLTDVTIAWPGQAETYPARIPDLYAGEPIAVTAALAPQQGEVRVQALRGGMPWQASFPLGPGEATGIDVLWARSKIEALADALHGGASEADVRPAVLEVALAHHLVSAYTSLVAVDVAPTLPAGTDATKTAMKSNPPQGWQEDAVIGELPRTATPAGLHIVFGAAALLLASLVWMRARVTSLLRG